jgi:MerR family mercuric resistance operon transcriptional regulator
MTQTMTIGKLAKEAGIGVETIRFYEREGLLPRPARNGGSGYRQYPPENIQRINFIRQAKDLGFSLKEIGELLSLRATTKAKCGSVKKKAEMKIADVEKKIVDLTSIKSALEALIAKCDAEKPTSECPILDAIDKNGGSLESNRK